MVLMAYLGGFAVFGLWEKVLDCNDWVSEFSLCIGEFFFVLKLCENYIEPWWDEVFSKAWGELFESILCLLLTFMGREAWLMGFLDEKVWLSFSCPTMDSNSSISLSFSSILPFWSNIELLWEMTEWRILMRLCLRWDFEFWSPYLLTKFEYFGSDLCLLYYNSFGISLVEEKASWEGPDFWRAVEEPIVSWFMEGPVVWSCLIFSLLLFGEP